MRVDRIEKSLFEKIENEKEERKRRREKRETVKPDGIRREPWGLLTL